MVANALAATGVRQSLPWPMVGSVLDMPVDELMVSGDDVLIRIIDAVLPTDLILDLVCTDGVMVELPPHATDPQPGVSHYRHSD